MKNKHGFTLTELMMGLIIFSLLLAALWNVFRAAGKNAHEVMANHSINDDIELTVMKLTDVIREANLISDKFPPQIYESDISNLKTDSPNNRLELEKINYDFTKDPLSLSSGQVNYTKESIKYFLEKDDSAKIEIYTLFKESLSYDSFKKPESSEMTIFPILSGIKRCVFYRLKDSSASRMGNVYINLELARNDSPYSNSITISVKERGTCPEY